MNFFEKIKNFFKNIGKKQQALPEAEIQEEIIDEMEGIENSHESQIVEESTVESTNKSFREELKFDPEDLLDPRVCKGDDAFPNILRTLGVNEAIINNPGVKNLFQTFGGGFLSLGERNSLKNGDLSRSQIEQVVSRIKSKGIIDVKDKEEIINWLNAPIAYQNPPTVENSSYAGINIDENGNLTIQYISSNAEEPYTEIVQKFSLDNEGNVIMTSETSKDNKYIDKYSKGTEKKVFNQDGVLISKDTEQSNWKAGQDKIVTNTNKTRDSQYPFMVREEKINSDGNKTIQYMALDEKGLDGMNSYEGKLSQGGQYIGPVTFDNREQMKQYYETNKEKIDKVLSQSSGCKKLAMKAGILQNEQETELSE